MSQILVRLLISGLLLFVIFICGRELWRLWLSRDVVLTGFTYIQNGASNPRLAEGFMLLVADDLQRLKSIYGAPKRQPESASAPAKTAAAPGGPAKQEPKAEPGVSATGTPGQGRFQQTFDFALQSLLEMNFGEACRGRGGNRVRIVEFAAHLDRHY